jgi:hypothetical protein
MFPAMIYGENYAVVRLVVDVKLAHGLFSLLLFLVASSDATLPLGESGVCKRQAPSQGTETQENAVIATVWR